MTKRQKNNEAAKSGFDVFMERITGRVGKITALVAALGGLVIAGLTQSDQIRAKLVSTGWYTPRPCVSIDTTAFPATVKLSEWDNTTVTLHGSKNCTTDLGLYVAFLRDIRNDQLFVVRPPRGNYKECNALRSDLFPNCWDFKKPLVNGKGEWSWNVPLPPLERLSDPHRVEKILVSWSVRDYDDPNKSPILADTAAITVQSEDGAK